MSPIDLSVALPCYNESGNLPELIQRFSELVQGKPVEVVLVNNGSTDGSERLFPELLAKIPNREQFQLVTIEYNRGYGHGIQRGLAACRGRILGFSHADLQCDPRNVLEAYDLFLKEEQRDPSKVFLVKGQRYDRREEEKLFSFNLDRLASVIMGRKMRDINGQPKIFSRTFYEKHIVGKAPLDLTFDLYVVSRAARFRIPIHTVPVYFEVRRAGVSSWNTTPWSRFKMVCRFLKRILAVRMKSLTWKFEG